MNKVSIRFFDDTEVRAVWDDEGSKWWFSVVDIIAVLSQSTDSRNYWYVLKSRLKKAGSEVLTNCKGFKLTAPDGKRRMTDCLRNGHVSSTIIKSFLLSAKSFNNAKQYSS